MKVRERTQGLSVEFANGIAVEVRLGENRTFGGLGCVRWRKRNLRTDEVPILPLIATPDGHIVCRLEVEDVQAEEGELRIALRPYVRLADLARRGAGEPGEVWTVESWGQPPVRDRGGRFQIVLREVSRLAGAVELAGFSYAYGFHSRKYKISCIHDRGSWELGGRATGNTVVMRTHCSPAVAEIRNRKDAFTTSRADEGGRQFRPLFSDLQGFTFQSDARGFLATAYEEPFACALLIQKNPGGNAIFHWHQLHAANGHASACAVFPALQVLYGSRPLRDPVEKLNCYEAVRTEIYSQYRQQLGLQGEQPPCAAHVDAAAFARQSDAAEAVEAIAAAGCSDLALEHVLAIREGPPGEGPGQSPPPPLSAQGRSRVHRVIELARGSGLQVGAVVGPGILRSRLFAPCTGARRREAQQRSLRRLLGRLKRELALDSITVRWGPGDGADEPAASDLQNETAVQRALQEKGFQSACSRNGVLGVSSAVVPYRLVRGRELVYRDRVMPFPHDEVVTCGDDPQRAYFRGYACRLCYSVPFGAGQDGALGLAPWWQGAYAEVNRAYRAVREHMAKARLLTEDRGVLWQSGTEDAAVLWAHKSFPWHVGERAVVYDVMARKALQAEGGTFHAREGRVYLVQSLLEP